MKRATNVRGGAVEEGRRAAFVSISRRGEGRAAPGADGLGQRIVTEQTGTRIHDAPSAKHAPTHTKNAHTTKQQIGRDQLVHLGTCVGKLTHSGKFRLTIGALDVLSQFAKHKVRVLVSVCCIWV